VNTILLPLLVATFIFSRAKRHPTLVNLCITWIFSGVFAILLFYADQLTRPEPSIPLCIAQATLLYGITPMWSVAVFMLFYFMAMAVRCDPMKSPMGRWKLLVMLTSPYIAQFSFSVAALILSLEHPEKVTRQLRFLYCALDHPKLSLANSLFTLLMCIGIVVLEIHLGIVAYRNHCGLRKAGKCSNGLDFAFYLRVLIFGAYIAFGMIVNIVSIFQPGSVVPDVYAATAGTGVFLVFGTQQDVLNVWCFWRRGSKEDEASGSIQVAFPCRTDSPTPSESSYRRDKPTTDVEDVPPLPPPKPRDYRISRGLLIPVTPEIISPPPVYGYGGSTSHPV